MPARKLPKDYHELAESKVIKWLMRKCDWCGKELKRTQKRFCSRTCYNDWKVENMNGELSPAWKGGNVKLVCIQCGKEFEVCLAWAKNGRKFCSSRCYGRWLSENRVRENHPSWSQVVLQCLQCGKEFEAISSQVKKGRKFCSKDCRQQWQRAGNMQKEKSPRWKGGKKEMLCEECGKLFEAYKRATKRFCSRKCAYSWMGKTKRGENHPRWLGGVSQYGPGFDDELKSYIRHRDEYSCVICGESQTKTRAFPVHHIDYDKNNHDRYNLVTLCNSCHGKTLDNRQFWQAILLPIAKGLEMRTTCAVLS